MCQSSDSWRLNLSASQARVNPLQHRVNQPETVSESRGEFLFATPQARAGFAEIGTEDWSSRVSPTYDRMSKYLPQGPDQRPNFSHPLPSAWSRSSACLPISCYRQFSGTDFPTPRAAPSARRFDEADFLNGRMSA